VLILDLREHNETWVRTKLGDHWLGFDDGQLRTLLESAGFEDVVVRVGARRSGDPFTVLIAAGTKGGSGFSRTARGRAKARPSDGESVRP
jgi:hypothetical protein